MQTSEVTTLGIFTAAICPQDAITSAVISTLLCPENMVVCNLFPEKPSPSRKNGLFDHNPFWKQEAARPDVYSCVIHGYLTFEQAWDVRRMLEHDRINIGRINKLPFTIDWKAPIIVVLPKQDPVDWKLLVHFAAVFALRWNSATKKSSLTVDQIISSVETERNAFVTICKHVFKHHSSVVPTHRGLSTTFADVMYALPWNLGPLQILYEALVETLPLPEDVLRGVVMEFLDDRSVREAPGWPGAHRQYTGCKCRVCESNKSEESSAN